MPNRQSIEYSLKDEARIVDLVRLVPADARSVLDVGARDGQLAIRIVERMDHVTALDLSAPEISHPRITSVRGDARCLAYPDAAFDIVMCTEVLEHIPAADLARVCQELQRVSRRYVLIGVPFRQDTRVGRTTCGSCGALNPPWGHVGTFDEMKLRQLFESMRVAERSFVGLNRDRSNWMAAALMNWAGNPWGTYTQGEPCIVCGAQLVAPATRQFGQRLLSRAAFLLLQLQRPFIRAQPNWIHVLFSK